ncbi:MAG: hypothetical protein ACOCXJ_07095 [Planctomycetota bacterium]
MHSSRILLLGCWKALLVLATVTWVFLPLLAWARSYGLAPSLTMAGDVAMRYTVSTFIGLAAVVVLLRMGISIIRLVGGPDQGPPVFSTLRLLGLVLLCGIAEILWQADRALAAGVGS